MQLRFLFALSLLLSAALNASAQRDKNEAPADNNRELSVVFVNACTEHARGDLESAAELFREVLKKDPGHHASLFELSRIEYARQDYLQAVELGRNALKLDPSNYWYHVQLAEVYQKQGDLSSAIAGYEEMLKTFPDRPAIRIKLANLYQQSGNSKKALAQLDAYEKQQGADAGLLLLRMEICAASALWPQAQVAGAALVALNPYNRHYHEAQHAMLLKAGKTDEAQAALRSMLEYIPGSDYALLGLARSGDMRMAQSYADRIFAHPSVSLNEKTALFTQLAAEPYKLPAATLRNYLKDMAALHPGQAGVWVAQGRLFQREGQADSAGAAFRKALRIEGGNFALWQSVLEASWQQKDYPQLYADASEAMEYFPNQEEVLYYFGMAAAANGKADDAAYAAEKLGKMTLNQESASRYERYGDLLYKLGQREKAIEQWNKAIAAGAKKLDVDHKMRQL